MLNTMTLWEEQQPQEVNAESEEQFANLKEALNLAQKKAKPKKQRQTTNKKLKTLLAIQMIRQYRICAIVQNGKRIKYKKPSNF